uniref:Uncharacterized protein n=1 Tax=Salix viminalis TaxID=40686 RepID=A0A6N2L671_SALVM
MSINQTSLTSFLRLPTSLHRIILYFLLFFVGFKNPIKELNFKKYINILLYLINSCGDIGYQFTPTLEQNPKGS